MRVFGHPLHPILVTFPISSFSIGTFHDLATVLGVAQATPGTGFLCLMIGLVTSVPALVTGFMEFLRLEPSSPAMRAAVWHGLLAFCGASLFATALAVRGQARPGLAVIALELAGLALIGVTGWLGGHLVFHHGIAVREAERALRK
jgi:uncharacterized membrane protein